MRPALFTLMLLTIGCDAPAPPPASVAANIDTFVPPSDGAAGSISGQVRWTSGQPKPVMLETYRPVPGGRADRVSRPAPNAPQVNPANGGVAGALVYLKGVQSAAQNWDYPLVSLELSEDRPMVRQGDSPARSLGLVRRGDAVTIVSTEERFHALRARGAAFWTFTLPDAGRPIVKRLDRPGIVELSSAAGYYWMHAYLFVSDHPYCAVTDVDGRFNWPQVPPGDYELVTWMPSWDVVRFERDPESTAVVRVDFGPHHEWRQKTTVRANETTTVSTAVPAP